MSQHRLGRFRAALDVGSTAQANAMQDRLNAFVRARLPALIEESFDQLDPTLGPITLDTLVIDLGTLPAAELERRAEAALREHLWLALQRVLLARPGAETAPSVLEALHHYLTFGQAHWRGGNSALGPLIDAALAETPEPTIALLRSLWPRAAVRQRLLWQTDAGVWRRLLERIDPAALAVAEAIPETDADAPARPVSRAPEQPQTDATAAGHASDIAVAQALQKALTGTPVEAPTGTRDGMSEAAQAINSGSTARLDEAPLTSVRMPNLSGVETGQNATPVGKGSPASSSSGEAAPTADAQSAASFAKTETRVAEQLRETRLPTDAVPSQKAGATAAEPTESSSASTDSTADSAGGDAMTDSAGADATARGASDDIVADSVADDPPVAKAGGDDGADLLTSRQSPTGPGHKTPTRDPARAMPPTPPTDAPAHQPLDARAHLGTATTARLDDPASGFATDVSRSPAPPEPRTDNLGATQHRPPEANSPAKAEAARTTSAPFPETRQPAQRTDAAETPPPEVSPDPPTQNTADPTPQSPESAVPNAVLHRSESSQNRPSPEGSPDARQGDRPGPHPGDAPDSAPDVAKDTPGKQTIPARVDPGARAGTSDLAIPPAPGMDAAPRTPHQGYDGSDHDAPGTAATPRAATPPDTTDPSAAADRRHGPPPPTGPHDRTRDRATDSFLRKTPRGPADAFAPELPGTPDAAPADRPADDLSDTTGRQYRTNLTSNPDFDYPSASASGEGAARREGAGATVAPLSGPTPPFDAPDTTEIHVAPETAGSRDRPAASGSPQADAAPDTSEPQRPDVPEHGLPTPQLPEPSDQLRRDPSAGTLQPSVRKENAPAKGDPVRAAPEGEEDAPARPHGHDAGTTEPRDEVPASDQPEANRPEFTGPASKGPESKSPGSKGPESRELAFDRPKSKKPEPPVSGTQAPASETSELRGPSPSQLPDPASEPVWVDTAGHDSAPRSSDQTGSAPSAPRQTVRQGEPSHAPDRGPNDGLPTDGASRSNNPVQGAAAPQKAEPGPPQASARPATGGTTQSQLTDDDAASDPDPKGASQGDDAAEVERIPHPGSANGQEGWPPDGTPDSMHCGESLGAQSASDAQPRDRTADHQVGDSAEAPATRLPSETETAAPAVPPAVRPVEPPGDDAEGSAKIGDARGAPATDDSIGRATSENPRGDQGTEASPPDRQTPSNDEIPLPPPAAGSAPQELRQTGVAALARLVDGTLAPDGQAVLAQHDMGAWFAERVDENAGAVLRALRRAGTPTLVARRLSHHIPPEALIGWLSQALPGLGGFAATLLFAAVALGAAAQDAAVRRVIADTLGTDTPQSARSLLDRVVAALATQTGAETGAIRQDMARWTRQRAEEDALWQARAEPLYEMLQNGFDTAPMRDAPQRAAADLPQTDPLKAEIASQRNTVADGIWPDTDIRLEAALVRVLRFGTATSETEAAKALRRHFLQAAEALEDAATSQAPDARSALALLDVAGTDPLLRHRLARLLRDDAGIAALERLLLARQMADSAPDSSSALETSRPDDPSNDRSADARHDAPQESGDTPEVGPDLDVRADGPPPLAGASTKTYRASASPQPEADTPAETPGAAPPEAAAQETSAAQRPSDKALAEPSATRGPTPGTAQDAAAQPSALPLGRAHQDEAFALLTRGGTARATPAGSAADEPAASDTGQTPEVQDTGRPAPSPPQDAPEPDLSIDRIMVENAGMVLLWPFLERFCAALHLTDGPAFADEDAAQRGAHLFQMLVTGAAQTPEHRLALNKVLCGLPLGAPVIAGITPTEAETELTSSLLGGVRGNWAAMQNTDDAGLRETFLIRQGILSRPSKEGPLILNVAQGPFDMLLDQLPWSVALIKLPWMTEALHVKWR